MNYKKNIAFLVLIISLASCTNQEETKNADLSNTKNEISITELRTGGLYIIKSKDSSYYVCKILVIDDFAIHIRTYRNKFIQKPVQINSKDLGILIGHAPLAKEGFLLDKPELLKIEEVKESELEGYKIYLEQMNK
jgi:hypothetical protein